MKKTLFAKAFASIVLLMLAITAWAQPKDAAYPVGNWQTTDYENGIISLNITRTTDSNGNCGTFGVEDGDGLRESALTYKGAGSDNTYVFDVVINGSTETIKVRKYRDDNGTLHAVLADVSDGLKNISCIGDEMAIIAGNGSAYDPTVFALTEDELKEALKEAKSNGLRADGFEDELNNSEEAVEEVAELEDDADYGMDDDTVSEEAETVGDPISGSSGSTNVQDLLIGILIIVVILGMLFHMLYVLLWPRIYEMIYKKKHPSVVWTTTVAEMKALRAEAGESEEMPEEETVDLANRAKAVFDTWTPLPNGEEGWIITTKKQMDESIAIVRTALDAHITDPDLIDGINEMAECINTSRKRQFDGSKLMVWLTIIFAGIMWYAVGFQGSIFFLLSLGIYYLASLKPNFMIDRRALKGKTGRGALNWLLGGVFGMIAGAQTVRTVTKWSDGSTTTDDDHTQHFVAWIIGLFVILLLIFCLLAWALVNWLRNYVFYR